MKFLLSLIAALIVMACSNTSQKNNDVNPPLEPIAPTEVAYSLITFSNADSTWGYRILNQGEPFINQPHIPAVAGNKGFSNQENAEKTGKFALEKLQQGIIPPTVSYAELDSLGVLD